MDDLVQGTGASEKRDRERQRPPVNKDGDWRLLQVVNTSPKTSTSQSSSLLRRRGPMMVAVIVVVVVVAMVAMGLNVTGSVG